jgi:hypothetical protein
VVDRGGGCENETELGLGGNRPARARGGAKIWCGKGLNHAYFFAGIIFGIFR